MAYGINEKKLLPPLFSSRKEVEQSLVYLFPQVIHNQQTHQWAVYWCFISTFSFSHSLLLVVSSSSWQRLQFNLHCIFNSRSLPGPMPFISFQRDSTRWSIFFSFLVTNSWHKKKISRCTHTHIHISKMKIDYYVSRPLITHIGALLSTAGVE